MRKWYLFIALAFVAVVVLAGCRAASPQAEIDRAVRATLTAVAPAAPPVEGPSAPTEPPAAMPTPAPIELPAATATPVPPVPLPPLLEDFTFRPEPVAAKGDPNAPVTVVEFSDYQCPWCRRFATEVLPPLAEGYINSGQVYFVYKDFPVLGPESLVASQAGTCAAQQGQFWPMHDRLFAASDQWKRQGAQQAREAVSRLANELGLDTAAFAACLDDPATDDEIRADYEEARRAGARGTPTLVINGHVVPGFLPWEQLQPLVEAALAEAGG